MLPISVGILSWDSHEVLEQTLKTYENNGLFKLVSDVTILFQNVSAEDKALARKYGIRFIGLDTNVGIGRGMQILAEQAKEEYFLFLENDWQLVEKNSTTRKRLIGAIDLLEENFKCVRLRSRKKYGHPLFSDVYKGNELNHFDENTGLISPHLFDCVHWKEDPDLDFPEQISKHKYHYVTTSRWSNWTNNPCLFKTNFLLSILDPFVSDRLLEPSMSKWWAEQEYKVAWGEGLFKHVDFKKYPTQKFDWGVSDQNLLEIIDKEIFVDRIYEKFVKVNEGDVVLDIGANVGAFTYSVLSAKPSKVVCVEPSDSLVYTLQTNVQNKGVDVHVENSAIHDETEKDAEIKPGLDLIYMNDSETFNKIKFKDLLNKYNIDRIDFMKVDCEGGEYSIFNEENFDFLTSRVKHVSGEWHLWGFDKALEKFIQFRNLYLTHYIDYKVFDRNDIDITHKIFDDAFLSYYSENLNHSAQFIIYINI